MADIISTLAPNDASVGIEYRKIIDTNYGLDRVSFKVNIPLLTNVVLLHRHTLREVARFIDIATQSDRRVVSQ